MHITDIVFESVPSDWSWEWDERDLMITFTHMGGRTLVLPRSCRSCMAFGSFIDECDVSERRRIEQWVAGKMLSMFPSIAPLVMYDMRP